MAILNLLFVRLISVPLKVALPAICVAIVPGVICTRTIMLCPGARTLWLHVSTPAFNGAQVAPADVVSETN
jgi:hypothetical protein